MGKKYGTNASIFDSDGNLKNTYEIMTEIAELYPKMTENEKQYIAIQAAGGLNGFCLIVQKCA